MKTIRYTAPLWIVPCIAVLCLSAARDARAATDIWKGTGSDGYWLTPANWRSGVAPIAGDALIFTNTSGLNNTNNFPALTSFADLTFATPAGGFALSGNQITLNGNVTNNQPVTVETINLPLALGATPLINVTSNGVLALGGVISGSFGLTKTGAGELDLTAANTFSGALTINGGSVAVTSDANLGTAPGSPTAGSLVLAGGELLTTTGFTINTNRGIAVGPGFGAIKVASGQSLPYGGIIADNGGAGGLTKDGYGSLTLFGANTYSGPTTNLTGVLTLDFTQPTAPANNIINPSSALSLGGGNAGAGGENVAQLVMIGKGATANAQGFGGAHFTFGGSAIVATNGASGTAKLALGALSHDPGGTVVLVSSAASGGGSITTTSTNVNGILGGWALISGDAGLGSLFTDTGHTLITGTNFASVDINSNLVNFTGYTNFNFAATLNSQIAGSVEPNILLNASSGSLVATVDNNNAGTTTDVNAINWQTYSGGFDSIFVGQGNTLRLGQYGGIIRNGPSTGNACYIGGINNSVQSGSGTVGSQDVGTLTAGGADNTPGEIVITANNPSETSGTTIFESRIADNGSGAVTVVKQGPGSIKLDGHNTFSGGLYLLQGRVQFTGSELGSGATTGNPGGGGTGPIFILPGAYLFPSSFPDGTSITNPISMAGNGDAHEPLGVLRGGIYSGPITLIGDANVGAGANIVGPVGGAFSLTLGSAATVNGGATLSNPNNAWTGSTTMTARNNTGNNTITSSNNEVIPDGFGKGNVTMQGYSTGTVQWDLHGFSETINGLSTSGNGANCFIENNVAATTSTLTCGGNDQSGSFSGLLRDSTGTGGTLALTKIGGGSETLTASNTYTGPTVINGGTLALSGAGSIGTSANIQVNAGGTLDLSALGSTFATTSPLGVNGGTVIGNASVGNLGLTNSALTLNIDTAANNIVATALTTGGATNLININTVLGVSKYPAFFPIIKYSGALGGAGNNFGIGNVPNTNTVGYVSNSVATSTIVLVLLNGPKVLTWTGADATHPTFWDLSTTTNWLAFKGTINQAPSAFSTADAVTFDDTGSTNNINVVQQLSPGSVEVTNNSLNYAFTGTGGINGKLNMTKDGTGSLTLNNGGNAGVAISGVFTINSGTVQVGNNDTSGSLSASAGIADNAALVYERSDTVTNSSAISGTGSLSQNSTAVLAVSGNNSFSGGVNIQQGTLKAGSGTALGSTNGTTTISSGATLDVGGQTLNTYPVVVSGTGVGGNGAIINSGADDTTALGNVTLTGNTTFGGMAGRWDIRGGAATLSTAGNTYNLTKTGTNYIALVGVNVDGSLGDINVQSGLFSVETTTTGLGSSANTLTVSSGATFQVYNTTVAFTKQFVLNGNGVATTLNCGNGAGNNVHGNFTLNGNCIFGAGGGDSLTLADGTISGGGSLLKVGVGTNIIAGTATATYSGGTTVSNGTLVVDGSLSGTVSVGTNATLAGNGTASGTVTVQNGSVSPGNIAGTAQGTLTVGALTLNNSTDGFELGTASTNLTGNDKIVVTGGLTLTGSNTLQITPTTFMSVGDTYTLIQYGGSPLPSSITNNLTLAVTRAGFGFHIVDPGTTPGFIKIGVDTALGNDFWTGAISSTWDTSATNWTRNGIAADFNNNDYTTFDDSSSVNNVNLSGVLTVSGMTMLNGTKNYHFGGTGSLTNTGALLLSGGATVTIANTGINHFQGPMTINAGVLQVGDGGTGGNLGTGVISNNASLVFDRSDNALGIPGNISGSGSLTNIGTGTVTLTGANTFHGEVDVVQGTLRVGSSAALGDTFGSTIVKSGATLDITNTANIGQEAVTITGTGVGGNGALVNSSGVPTFVGPNLSQLTIDGDVTIGGSGRLDLRASAATATDAALFTTGGNPTLTKVGTNQFQISGAQIDPALGNIDVQAGTFGLQWQLPLGVGGPTYSLTLHSNTLLNLFDLSNDVQKVFIMTNATVFSQHGSNVLNGPLTITGVNTFTNANGAVMVQEGSISGSGSLVKSGASTLALLTGPESYTGDTLVNGGTLALTEPVALTNSPNIILSGGPTVDVSQRLDDTLTLGGGGLAQALIGGGTINGTLVENSGSTVNPGKGSAPAVLTVTNGVTLNGTVIMDLDRSAGTVTNDQIAAISNLTITVSGPLIVSNVGPTLVIGDTFKLFSQPVSGFSSVILPQTNVIHTVAYSWLNNLGVDGSITLASTTVLVNTNATNITVSASGGNLTLSWPADHSGWRLQVQTNTLATGLRTNWVTIPGSDTTNSITVPIGTSNGSVFYRIIYP